MYGAVPPLTVTELEYAALTTPFGNVPEIADSVMVTVNVLELFPAVLAALTVNEYAPAFVGVPDSVPVLPNVSPGGRVPPVFVHVKGAVPVALRVCEYACFIATPGSLAAVVIFGAVAPILTTVTLLSWFNVRFGQPDMSTEGNVLLLQ